MFAMPPLQKEMDEDAPMIVLKRSGIKGKLKSNVEEK